MSGEFNPSLNPDSAWDAALLTRLITNANGGTPITTQSGASVTIADSMRGTEQHLTNAAPTVTIPTGLTVSGFFCLSTVNAATITADAGVLLNGVDGDTVTLAAYGVTTIRVTAADEVFIPLGGAG